MEKEYENIINSLEDGYCEVDIAGNLTFFNDALCKIYGYARDELIGMNNREYMSSDTARRADEVFNSVYKTGKPAKIFDWEFIKKDGTKIDVEISVSLTKNSEGVATGFRGIVRDISERKRLEAALEKAHNQLERRVEERTKDLVEINKQLNLEINERKQVEKELRKSQDNLRLAGQIAHIGYWSRDLASNKITWSRETCRIFGLDPQTLELNVTTLLDYIQPEDGQMVLRAIQEADAGIRPYEVEFRALRPDGTVRWIHSKGEINFDEDGGSGRMFGTLLDITERKRAEDALQESETRLRTIFDVSQAGIILVDARGVITYANQGMAKMFRCTQQELTGSSYPEHIHPDKRSIGDQRMRQLIASEIDSVALEQHYIRLDGTDFWGFLSGRRHEDKKGNFISLVGIIADITEQKILENEQRQANKMESIGTLTGGIAHDFNNILGIIVGNTELALNDVPECNPARSCLEEIKTACLRATKIVKQLLSFSRKADQELQPIEIALVIKDALKFLRSTIPTTIDIQQDIQVTDEAILADPTQINQIIMNLCINAFHAMEQTGGNLAISVEKVMLDNNSAKDYPDLRSGEHVKVRVKDTGPGIDPDIIDRIFDPYFTTKEVGKGSGMGLAVVHGIVKSHHGAIFVDSTPGKGTTFSIFFPITTEKPGIEKDASEEPLRGSETVLFVDDETSIVKTVRGMLERLGYQVKTAMAPQDALELLSADPRQFDLVITDMAMPKMTGVMLSEKIMEIRPDIPVIICTGHSALIDEKRAKELGIAAYVMKPINMTEIAKTIRKVLDGANSSAQH
jgi:PAS domain S-box-containing protein